MSMPFTVQGTVKPDGNLELDEKLALPSGRVWVTVQPLAQTTTTDAFWRRMEAIWAGQQARGHVARSVEETERQRRSMQEDMEDELQEAVRVRAECRPVVNQEPRE